MQKLLTVSEAAERIGVSVPTLRKWADTGVIEVRRLPGSGYRRFEPEIVEAFVDQMTEPGKISGLNRPGR